MAAFPLLLAPALGNMYDVVMPSYIPGCAHGCASWASLSKDVAAMFATADGPRAAGQHCAMPANHSGMHECDCGQKDDQRYMTDSYAGPWCYCLEADGTPSTTTAYCTPPNATVEQLNLQIADPTTVVASFVTYEPLPSSAPVAMLGESEDALTTTVLGVSHEYKPPGRDYVLHYIKFGQLKPRTTYYYKVKSGSDACGYSAVYSFRSGYTTGVTRLATYGDMGHSHYNNVDNMLQDCKAGTIDAIVHLGDHAYDLGFSGDRRGDAYMNAIQQLVAACPWYPIVGNHEGNDGDHYNRYMNIAWGEAYGQGALNPPSKSTATTALGELVTKGTMYASVHGTVPSNTSRYTATNYGLIHMIGLDLMNFDDTQVAWLEADLKAAAANRANVPWIMAMAHYPVYHSSLKLNAHMSAAHFLGEQGEPEIEGQPLPARVRPKLSAVSRGGVDFHTPALPLFTAPDGHAFVPCDAEASSCTTVGEWHATVSSKLEPLLLQYGVDLFNAGHVHDYESTWPMKGGKVVQTNYTNPRAPVHVTEGNGGVPGVVGTYGLTNCTSTGKPWCRMHGTGGAYGRVIAHNATHLTYEHVQNNGGAVTDTWTIVQTHHGPFA